MSWLDVLIALTLVASFVGGLATGFLRGLLTLIGLIAGIVIAGRLYSDLATHLSFIHHDGAASVVAFAIIFLATMLLAAIIAQILRAVIARVMLGCLDRFLGGVMGLLSGALFWGLILALWAKFFGGDTLGHSLLAPFLATKFPPILAMLPSEFDVIKEFFR